MPDPDCLDERFPTLYSLPKKKIAMKNWKITGEINIDIYVGV